MEECFGIIELACGCCFEFCLEEKPCIEHPEENEEEES